MAPGRWCSVYLQDTGKLLTVTVGPSASSGSQGVISWARRWLRKRQHHEPTYPLSNPEWIVQAICSDLVKATTWDKDDLVSALSHALLMLTHFDSVLVEGTSDGTPISITELKIKSPAEIEALFQNSAQSRREPPPTLGSAGEESSATNSTREPSNAIEG